MSADNIKFLWAM